MRTSDTTAMTAKTTADNAGAGAARRYGELAKWAAAVALGTWLAASFLFVAGEQATGCSDTMFFVVKAVSAAALYGGVKAAKVMHGMGLLPDIGIDEDDCDEDEKGGES